MASLFLPFPFTLAGLVITAFCVLSHHMKGGNGDKYGTSFFIACLALVDILLRVNWLTLAILLVAEETYGSVLWCLGLIFVQAFLNLVIWRRFFKFKYNMDDNDLHFV